MVTEVHVQADWLTYATAAATVLAALLALVAIVYSGRLSRRAEADLRRERRLDFELGVLADLSYQFSITGRQHISGYMLALIHEGNTEDLLVLRAIMGVLPTPEGQARLAEIAAEVRERESNSVDARFAIGNEQDAEIRREIAAAIARRVTAATPA